MFYAPIKEKPKLFCREKSLHSFHTLCTLSTPTLPLHSLHIIHNFIILTFLSLHYLYHHWHFYTWGDHHSIQPWNIILILGKKDGIAQKLITCPNQTEKSINGRGLKLYFWGYNHKNIFYIFLVGPHWGFMWGYEKLTHNSLDAESKSSLETTNFKTSLAMSCI